MPGFPDPLGPLSQQGLESSNEHLKARANDMKRAQQEQHHGLTAATEPTGARLSKESIAVVACGLVVVGAVVAAWVF